MQHGVDVLGDGAQVSLRNRCRRSTPASRVILEREEWEVLAAQGEWLRTAHAGDFAPWPHTANERRWLLALHLAHHKVVLEWCERHFDARRRGAAP